MKFDLKQPMTVFARVEGEYGVIRELSAIVDFNSTYCLLFAKDAIDIGYSQAANRAREYRSLRPDEAPYLLGMRGIESGILFALKKVTVGDMTVENVNAISLELEPARMLPFDMILGQSFLKNATLHYDGKNGTVSIS